MSPVASSVAVSITENRPAEPVRHVRLATGALEGDAERLESPAEINSAGDLVRRGVDHCDLVAGRVAAVGGGGCREVIDDVEAVAAGRRAVGQAGGEKRG